MRLDVWLHKVCLLKSRSQAKNGCRSGKILLGGQPVKESHQLRIDEELSLGFPQHEITLRVLSLPEGNVARKDGPDHYEILAEGPPRSDED